ncbi:unnamed protein product [Rangifer tarandus platyrhynchus]|uniref:Uncharacterized protein n=2 Tax=Rangifer tarandus platyrhynchus TaxID=3082113 RepID=A0AC59YHV3_RANTA|nr:unnamed protein product [Rangifer tarandus platyrhynchus]
MSSPLHPQAREGLSGAGTTFPLNPLLASLLLRPETSGQKPLLITKPSALLSPTLTPGRSLSPGCPEGHILMTFLPFPIAPSLFIYVFIYLCIYDLFIDALTLI